MIKISNDHLPCFQAFEECNLSENLLQNQIGETPNIYVFECCIIKTCLARKHFKSSCIVLCRSSGCHFELMKLCTSHLCPIHVSKSLFDIFQKDIQCLHLSHSIMTAMVSFTAQTCAMPPCMKESVYKIFILLFMKVSACMVTMIRMTHTNSSVLSRFPSKGSGLAALAFQIGLCKVWGFVMIACATAWAAAEATLVISSCVSVTQLWKKVFDSLSCCTCSC